MKYGAGRRRGFTLFEMLVVITIIVILTGSSVALISNMFRGQGVRHASAQVRAAFANAKQFAANQRIMHFMVFINKQVNGADESGVIEIHKDADQNRTYNGDLTVGTSDPDPSLIGTTVDLPKFVMFKTKPDWVGINPTGYCAFPPGFNEVGAGTFDSDLKNNKLPAGDIILNMPNQTYYMALDVDPGAGKIRKSFFLNQ